MNNKKIIEITIKDKQAQVFLYARHMAGHVLFITMFNIYLFQIFV